MTMMMTMRSVILAAAMTLVATAMEAQTIGVHIVKAGETLMGITARYLGSSADWRENWKLNPTLRDPHKLTPGMRLQVIIARRVPARNAEVWQVAQKVERQPTPAPWTPATVGDRLHERHGLRTHESSSAGLRFDDGATLVLTENSLVFLRESTPARNAIARDSIEIVEGQADVETRRTTRDRSAEIEVLVGGAAVRPQEARSQTRARAVSRAAQFMVYDGKAAVEAAGATLDVPTGMGTRVPEGGAPGPLEKLLAAPSAIEPLAGAARVGAAPFRWGSLKGAERYAVEVCRDALCASLVRRATVAATSWTPRHLPTGEFFWRVRGVSPSGLDGYATTPLRFSNSLVAAGSIFDEGSGAPFGGARVVAYRDGGVLVAETVTNDSGRYALALTGTGTYWIAVDSRTLRKGVWPEQTAGPSGSICSGTERSGGGPCVGGRRPDQSDDARALDTSEHVARVQVDDDGADRIDFRFRSDVVTTTLDAGQGSLRQFIVNANALPGPDAMRFVPAQRAPGGFWSIALATALPELTGDTIIDGGARGAAGEYLSSSGGPANQSVAVGTAGTMLLPADQAELEIIAAGLPHGLRARQRLTLRNIALSGADTNVDAHGEIEIDNVVIGARADGLPIATPGGTGIALSSAAHGTIRRAYVTAQANDGIRVDGARLVASHLEVTRGGGVALNGSLADIRYSLLGAVEIRPGSGADRGNVLEQNTLGSDVPPTPGHRLAGNVVRPAD